MKTRYGGWSIEADDSADARGRIWFNNKGRHAMPSFYNAFSNTLLRTAMAGKGVSDAENYGKDLYMCNKGRHAMPSFCNAFSNTLLRTAMAGKGVSDAENNSEKGSLLKSDWH